MEPMLVSNPEFAFLHLLSAGITGMHHLTQILIPATSLLFQFSSYHNDLL
jgi:hypothetical protein